MYKRIAVLLILLSTPLFAGCGSSQEQSLSVYSFSGQNDRFSVSNGVIIRESDRDTLYGGILTADTQIFDDVTSYSVTVYTLAGGERKTILSNRVMDMTGCVINVGGDMGKVSGSRILFSDRPENNLYVELSATDINGDETTDELQLSVVKITG